MSIIAYVILAVGIIMVCFLGIALTISIYTAIPDQDQYDYYEE
jgi:hypothetical protein